MSSYNEFMKRGERPVYFDMDRKILVDPENLLRPCPPELVPWFSTRYPVKVVLQPVRCGAPAAIGQVPLAVSVRRGRTEYATVFSIGDFHPWFVVPSLEVSPGPVRVSVRDGLWNVVLEFDAVCVDAVPEHPGYVPTVFSNPTSVRIRDEGERVVRQPSDRSIRLQRDAAVFIVDDFTPEQDSYKMKLDFGSLVLDTYYGCNRILIEAKRSLSLTCDEATLTVDTLQEGWHEGRITVFPNGTAVVNFLQEA